MFHLQTLELLHWDYCQRISLPLDAAIVTIAGPNGSGKTTLLDAMRTLLGLECSGGRSYKTYARHANAGSAWLRAVVDNRPRGRQSSTRPFASSLLYDDRVTLACRIERNGGDWQRRYLLAEGDTPIEALTERPEKDMLGLDTWRRRLAGAGLTPAIARVLSLEQGQTDRLCELSPRELLRLVFDVFGDQEVLDKYELARSHQQQLAREVEQAERELAHARTQLAGLALRVTSYHQRQGKLRERERLATEVLPVMQWTERRTQLTDRARELHRQRMHATAQARHHSEQRKELLALHRATQDGEADVMRLGTERDNARQLQDQARDAERPVEELVKRFDELTALAAIESDQQQLAAKLQSLEEDAQRLATRWVQLSGRRQAEQEALDTLQGRRQPDAPPDVQQFQRALNKQGIGHHLLADVVQVRDEAWRAAIEGVLRPSRWIVVLARHDDEAAAFALAERERYRHYVVAQAENAPAQPPAGSLLSAVGFDAPVPGWLLRQLAGIRCVADTAEGTSSSGEWITRQAYYRDGRGGRSVWVDPSQHQFGAHAVAAQRTAREQALARIERELLTVARDQEDNQRQLKDAQRAAQGHSAAQELAHRSSEFAKAREALPALQATRRAASARWQQLQHDHEKAVRTHENTQGRYLQLQDSLRRSEPEAERQARDWAARRGELRAGSQVSREQGRRFPLAWRVPAALNALQEEFGSAKQAELRAAAIERELQDGAWETDDTVEERHHRMQVTVGEQELQLNDRRVSNEQASTAVLNARERYIEVLRSTVRRYRKNIAELGELAGVEVMAELPHLDNDDVVLAQAGLAVRFRFDGKAAIGLNDGEASGGQQVLKSLILLVGLMKDDEMPGGFVFIDEPFAHLDVRNIQLVGHFLRSTRAQYLLTTPITHNLEVFEPSEITLVTSKKPLGERWAPPIAVLQRRGEPDLMRPA